MIRLKVLLPAIAVLCGLATSAAAAPAKSVQQLFEAIPPLPATAAEAAKWFNKEQKLIHPGLLALKADIAAHQRAMESIGMAGAKEAHAQAQVQMEAMGQGMADVGIDMERAKTDPAYAASVQERMKKMSPAELMAMSQAMNRPMNQDKRIKNEAQVMVNDPAAVKSASEAGAAYNGAQMQRLNAHDSLWKSTEQVVRQINAKPLNPGVAKPTMEYDNPGCDNACQAAWDAYASKMLPLLTARDTEVLLARRSVFDRERAAQANDIKTANGHLLATQYGAGAQAQLHRGQITGYDASVLGEIELLATKVEDIVKQAAIRTNCGKQVVLVPLAVCH